MCPSCGAPVEDGAAACSSCGASLAGSNDGPVGEGAERFSHSGVRYLLGYGRDFFGIWDRMAPGGATYRFPRTDRGWGDAWRTFSGLEPGASSVTGPPERTGDQANDSTLERAPTAEPAGGGRPASGFWFLLPIFFSIIGGLIAWGFTRRRDPRMARILLIVGFVVFAINLYLVESGAIHLGGT